MRKKRTLLICLLSAGLALIAFVALKPTSREPSYDGHPLSYWVVRLNLNLDRDKATNAIDHIGVAALPFLVKWLSQNHPTRWKRVLAYKLQQTRNPLATKLSDLIIDRNAQYLAGGSAGAFEVLGTRAAPAFDDLYRLMNTRSDVWALWSLSRLGPKALPPLLTLVTNDNSPLRFDAIRAIATMPDLGDAAQTAIPALTNFLSETENPGVRYAIGTLGSLKASPQISIPAILPFLKSNDPKLRWYAAIALGQFGPQAVSAIPALTNAMTDPDKTVRQYATQALQQIAPATFPNTPGQ